MIYRLVLLSSIFIAGIGVTTPAYGYFSSSVPFVGCKSDGQVGPENAPTGKPKMITISQQLARGFAYYKAADGLGVLAPRGWYCFGTYGSNGSNLYVTPTPLTSAQVFSDRWKGISGYGIQLSERNGDTSGRFEVAQIIARLFPAQSSFVRQVIAEDIEPATAFPRGPYPADRLTYKSKDAVEYVTPPNTEGLGTKSFLVRDTSPIAGVVLLTGEEPNLTHLSVRLPPEMSDLLSVIIQQVEEDSFRSASHASVTSSTNVGTPGISPESSNNLSDGVRESPAGCFEGTAHTNGPCKLTWPNGNIMETGADGVTWLTVKKRDIKFQVSAGIPVSGQFQTIIIGKLPESDIVEAPQYIKTSIHGDCRSRTYQIWGTAVTDPNGVFDSEIGPEDVSRRVIPDTPVDTVFHVFCDASGPRNL